MRTILFNITDEETVCANCIHYYQHYVKTSPMGDKEMCMCGHCVYPRIKHHKPYDTCKNFEKRKDD